MDLKLAVTRAAGFSIANRRDYMEACTFIKDLKLMKRQLETAVRVLSDMVIEYDRALDDEDERLQESPLKLAGLAKRTFWRYVIIDAERIPREYLMPDKVKIGQVVRAMKSTSNIAGIEAYPETILAVRSETNDEK